MLSAIVVSLALVTCPAQAESMAPGFAPAKPELMLGTALSVPPAVKEVERTSWRWTPSDYALEAVVLALIAVDWRQTLAFRAQGIRETNPILGPYPSRARVNFMIGGAMLGHVAVAAALPHGFWRTTWQASVGGAEALAVKDNWENGWKPF